MVDGHSEHLAAPARRASGPALALKAPESASVARCSAHRLNELVFGGSFCGCAVRTCRKSMVRSATKCGQETVIDDEVMDDYKQVTGAFAPQTRTRRPEPNGPCSRSTLVGRSAARASMASHCSPSGTR